MANNSLHIRARNMPHYYSQIKYSNNRKILNLKENWQDCVSISNEGTETNQTGNTRLHTMYRCLIRTSTYFNNFGSTETKVNYMASHSSHGVHVLADWWIFKVQVLHLTVCVKRHAIENYKSIVIYILHNLWNVAKIYIFTFSVSVFV